MNSQQQAFLESLNAQAQALQQQISQFRMLIQTTEPAASAMGAMTPGAASLAQMVDQAVAARLAGSGANAASVASPAGQDAAATTATAVVPKLNAGRFGTVLARQLPPEDMLFLMSNLDRLEAFALSEDGGACLKLIASEFHKFVSPQDRITP